MSSQEAFVTESETIQTQPDSKKSNSQSTPFSTMLIIGSALFLIIIVAIIYYIKSSANNNKELIKANEKYEEMVKRNNELQAEMSELQEDNKHYIQHINHLSDQLEQQQKPMYSPLTPMTVNSYEAPDPDQAPTVPQPIKDKKAIRAMVNSKRPTVQDEIDNRKHQEEEQENNDEEQTKKELKNLTNDGDDAEDDDDDKNENVEDLMTIIQSQ